MCIFHLSGISKRYHSDTQHHDAGISYVQVLFPNQDFLAALPIRSLTALVAILPPLVVLVMQRLESQRQP